MSELIDKLKKLCYECGEIALIRKKNNLVIEIKNDSSPVTNADKEIDQIICQTIKTLTPEIKIISEEGEIDNISESTYWLIDPIDGTKSYISGEDTYTVNIALIENYVPVLGLIYQPETKILHYTDANRKLAIEQNGKPIGSNYFKKNDGFIGTCSPNLSSKIQKTLQEYFNLSKILPIFSSKKLCLIAEGSIDIFFCLPFNIKEWDIAAGHALVLANGGQILTLDGNKLIYGNNNFDSPNFFALSNRFIQEPNTKNLIKNYLSRVIVD